MSPLRTRLRPRIEALESRLALNAAPAPSGVSGDVDGDGTVGTDDLRAFAAAYLSHRGQSNYNPAVVFNGNGYVGQPDARPILRALAPVTPRRPLRVSLALGPGDQVRGHHPANSGGVTRRADVTVIGRTTPNSIVFTDAITGPKAGNFKFVGPAVPADARGYFSLKLHLRDALTQTEYLVRDPFGRQTIFAFPIRLL